MTRLLRRSGTKTTRRERVERTSPSHGVPVTPMPALYEWKGDVFVTVETAATPSGTWAYLDENDDLQIEPATSEGYAYIDGQGDLMLEIAP